MSDAVERPAPEPDEASAPFFEGARQGRLVLQRCNRCSAPLWPVKPVCDVCLSRDIGWGEVSGRATLYSCTVIHHVSHPSLSAAAPYNVAVVELEEGLRIVTNVVGADPMALPLDQPMRVQFRVAGGVDYPVFEPSEP